MSEDKKAPTGPPRDESVDAERTNPKATGAVTGGATKVTKIDQHDQQPGPARARNQDVLPGILGKQLRAAYSELLNAPVPDAITQLVKQLESKEPAARPQKADKPRREESGQ
jgi:Anti-sigma factor NepR